MKEKKQLETFVEFLEEAVLLAGKVGPLPSHYKTAVAYFNTLSGYLEGGLRLFKAQLKERD